MTSKMLKAAPDHHDAQIVMTLYDLRRETMMRASREALSKDFWPRSWEDVLAVTKADHPLNLPYRQVTGYWEMAYGMVKYGVLHGDFMLESGGEGLFIFARVKPYLAQLRDAQGPRAFANCEWVANHSEGSRAHMARLDARIAAMTKAK